MPRRADADIVEGDALDARFLDLMLEEKRARRLPLPLVLGERRERDAEPVMAERPAEAREHFVADPEVSDPEPARIVALKRSDFAVEGSRVSIEDVFDAHGGELARLLCEEQLEQRERLLVALRPAIDDGSRLCEFARLPLERAARALAEPRRIELGEIAEPYRVAAARRRLVRKLGEGIPNAVPFEWLRGQDRRHGARLAADFRKKRGEIASGELAGGRRREQSHIVVGVLDAEPFDDGKASDVRRLERPQKEKRTVGSVADGDDRFTALWLEAMSRPGTCPIERLRSGAGRDRLQALPILFDARKIAGNAQRHPPKASRDGNRAVRFDQATCDLGLGA